MTVRQAIAMRWASAAEAEATRALRAREAATIEQGTTTELIEAILAANQRARVEAEDALCARVLKQPIISSQRACSHFIAQMGWRHMNGTT